MRRQLFPILFGGASGGYPRPSQFTAVVAGQSLGVYPFIRGTPRVIVDFLSELRSDLAYSTSGTITGYSSSSFYHDGSSQNASDWTVRAIDLASSGSPLVDINSPSDIATLNYWWNTQDNSATTGNVADTANTPGPLLRAFAAGVAGKTVNAIVWSQGTADAGGNLALCQSTLITVLTYLRTYCGRQTIPIFIHRLGRNQSLNGSSYGMAADAETAVANGALKNVYISAEEYPVRLAAKLALASAGLTNGSNVVTLADTSALATGQGIEGANIPSGAYISAIVANTSITLSKLDSTGVETAANVTATATQTIYQLDSVHPYPGDDAVQPLDTSGGTKHNETDGFYWIYKRSARYIARRFGGGQSGVSGPYISGMSVTFGSPYVDVSIAHDGGTDLNVFDATGWRVTLNGVQQLIQSVSKTNASTIRLTLQFSLGSGTVNLWYGWPFAKLDYTKFITDNATVPMPLRLVPTQSPITATIAAQAQDADATAWGTAMTTPPNAALTAQQNELVTYLKATTNWALLDMFEIFAMPDSQAAKIDIRYPANSATETGTISFTANFGYTGNAGAVITGYDPFTNGTRGLGRDDAAYSIYMLGSSTTGNADLCSVNSRVVIRGRSSSNAQGRCNAATSTAYAADTFGNSNMVTTLRRDGTTEFGYKNGVQAYTTAKASNGLPSMIEVGRTGGGATYSDRPWGAVCAGKATTAQQEADKFAGIHRFLAARGAVTLAY